MEIKHRVFVSKGTLDLSRGRSIRQLEAELDRQETKHQSCESPALLTFEEETLDKIDKEIKEKYVCIYTDICPLHKYSMKCIFGKDKCRTFHFYNCYAEFDFRRQLEI